MKFQLIKDSNYEIQGNTNVLDYIGCRTSGKQRGLARWYKRPDL